MTRFVGIDPSTKTGFVALDEKGQVVRAKVLTGVSDQDPKRMVTLIHEVISHVQKEDIICIEGFPFDTQRAMFAGGLHHGIRNELYKRGFSYYEAAPNAVKKFVEVTGWKGEVGCKVRLKDKEKKAAVKAAVLNHYRFTHTSDNIIDSYIMAQIAYELHIEKQGVRFHVLPSYQQEVIQQILNPAPKVKKNKAKS